MAKKKRQNVAVVYLVTIVITFLLVGGTAYMIYQKYLQPTLGKPQVTASTAATEYAPTVEECQTVLYIFDANGTSTDAASGKSDVVFLLGRFLPTEKKFILAPLYPDTFAQLNTTKSTLYDFYRKEGTEKLVAAAQAAVNIPITQYMRFDKPAFESLCDILGGARVNVPNDLIYDNLTTGESTVIRAGEQNLDGIRLRQMFTFPEFKDGEEYRAKIVASTVTDMINSALGERLLGSIDNSFKTIINAVDSNINAYDFSQRHDAIAYLIKEGEKPVMSILPIGKANDKGQFVLSEAYKEDILYRFKVEAKVK